MVSESMENPDYADIADMLLTERTHTVAEFGGSLDTVYPHVKKLYDDHGPFEIQHFERRRWPVKSPPSWYEGGNDG